jgi:hypothetical protein
MATEVMDVATRIANVDTGRFIRSLDRWIFPAMAALFFVTTLVGFIPSSMAKLAAVEAGQRPPLPPILHLHAVLMGSWLLLLLAQTSIVAADRRALHRKLGLIALVLVPAMVITGFVLVPTSYAMVWAMVASAPAEMAEQMQGVLGFATNIALVQFRMGILFPVLVGWALYVRRTDPETHKRLMILATVLPLPAAIDRIAWLPSTLPVSPLSQDLYVFVWILPLLVYDLLRHKRVPRAYFIWMAVNVPLVVVTHLLWGSEWWMTTAPKLLGVVG